MFLRHLLLLYPVLEISSFVGPLLDVELAWLSRHLYLRRDVWGPVIRNYSNNILPDIDRFNSLLIY